MEDFKKYSTYDKSQRSIATNTTTPIDMEEKKTPKELMTSIKNRLFPKVATGELMNWENLADAMHDEIRDYYLSQPAAKEPTLNDNKVVVERIMDAVHKCLQFEDDEIAGIDPEKLEQKIRGILSKEPTDLTKICQGVLKSWLKFKKDNWWESDSVDVESKLMKDFMVINGFTSPTEYNAAEIEKRDKEDVLMKEALAVDLSVCPLPNDCVSPNCKCGEAETAPSEKIFIDGDFNGSYESRVRGGMKKQELITAEEVIPEFMDWLRKTGWIKYNGIDRWSRGGLAPKTTKEILEEYANQKK